MFRGQDIKTGKWIEGYYFKSWEQTYILWGMTNGVPNMTEVHPHTISQQTRIKDKNNHMIYGSIEIEGEMTKGGDVIRYLDGYDTSTENGYDFDECSSEGQVKWLLEEYPKLEVTNRISVDMENVFEDCEIIGKQCEDINK